MKYCWLVVLFIISGCIRTKILENEIESFIGSSIVIPESFNIQDAAKLNSRGLIWFDSLECSSCQLNRLYEWDNDPFAQYAQGLPGKFEVVLIFSPKKEDVHSLKFNLEGYDVSFPVIIDEAGDFPRMNPHIPADKRLHSFLLDKDNRVVMVGKSVGQRGPVGVVQGADPNFGQRTVAGAEITDCRFFAPAG